MGDLTVDTYWDCECEGNYINPKSVKSCPKCGADQDEQPDSMQNEVTDMNLNRMVIHIGDGYWVDESAVKQAQAEGFDLIDQ